MRVGVPELVTHFGRNPKTIHNDRDRFEQLGVKGLADGKALDMKPSVILEIAALLNCKLAKNRAWNSTLLGEAVHERFGVTLGREVIRVKLLELGYRRRRTRYAPGQDADSEDAAMHRAIPETLS